MDQGRQVRREVDAAVVPELQGQPGTASALRVGVQPRQLPASPGATEAREALVADPGAPGLREKLIKIGPKVVRHAKYMTFHMAEVAVPRELFAMILDRIQRFGAPTTLGRRTEER